MDFKEGDIVKLKLNCSEGVTGKLYMLAVNEDFCDDENEDEDNPQLIAIDPNTLDRTCSCYSNWILVEGKGFRSKEGVKENNKNFVNLGRVFNF